MEGSRDGWQRAGHGDVGQVQGPLQLSSTAMAWKEALGDADVGKWDLIYRYHSEPRPMQGCFVAISLSQLLITNEADRQPFLAEAQQLDPTKPSCSAPKPACTSKADAVDATYQVKAVQPCDRDTQRRM